MSYPLSQQRRMIGVSFIAVMAIGTMARAERRRKAISQISKTGATDIAPEKLGDILDTKFIIGVGFAFTIISIATDLGSPIGGGFAVLTLLTVALESGEDALGFLGWRGVTGQSDAEAFADSKRLKPYARKHSKKSIPRRRVNMGITLPPKGK